MATWVQVVGGLALLITGGGVIAKFIRAFGRAVSMVDDFWPLVSGDPKASPPVPALKDRLSAMQTQCEAAARDCRVAKETSVAVLNALRRKGMDL